VLGTSDGSSFEYLEVDAPGGVASVSSVVAQSSRLLALEPSIGASSQNVRALGAALPKRDRTVTIFQAGHGWATNAGGSANLNDTTDFVFGSQSASITTDGAATAKTLKLVGFTAANAATWSPVIAIKVDDQTHLAAMQLYLGDTNLANHYKWEFKSTTTAKWVTSGDWVVIVLAWGDATVVGAPSRAAITDGQFRAVDDAAGTVTMHCNLLGFIPEQTVYPNGVVSFSFDDAYSSQYTDARAILDLYGFSATAFVILEYLGVGGRLTLAQCKALRDFSRWSICGHATTGAVHAARFTSLTAAQLDVEFQALKRWCADNGFDGRVAAYPGGEYNATVLEKTAEYFLGARTVFQAVDTLPPSNAVKLRTAGYLTSATLPATITAAIDAAYAGKNWLHIVGHSIVAVPAVSTDYSIANFQTIVDYAATKGIAVATIGDVLSQRLYAAF